MPCVPSLGLPRLLWDLSLCVLTSFRAVSRVRTGGGGGVGGRGEELRLGMGALLLLFRLLGEGEGEADLRRSVALLWLWGGAAGKSRVPCCTGSRVPLLRSGGKDPSCRVALPQALASTTNFCLRSGGSVRCFPRGGSCIWLLRQPAWKHACRYAHGAVVVGTPTYSRNSWAKVLPHVLQ